MGICFPSRVPTNLVDLGLEGFPRLLGPNLGRSQGNWNCRLPYQASTPKLTCLYQSSCWKCSWGPCSVSCQFLLLVGVALDLWQSAGRPQVRRLLWSSCVGDNTVVSVTLCHLDPSAASSVPRTSLLVLLALSTYSSHIATQNESLIFRVEVGVLREDQMSSYPLPGL